MKENQRITVTKRMLQEGLIRLLQTKPIEKIKIVELCEEAGINRATFYRHYTLPRDVLDEIRRTILLDIRALIGRKEAGKNLQKDLEMVCQYCYEHSDQLKLLFANRTDEGFAQLIGELYHEYLPELQKAHQGYRFDPTNMKLASYYYTGGFFFILRQWLTENIEKSPLEVATLICQFISGGKNGE